MFIICVINLKICGADGVKGQGSSCYIESLSIFECKNWGDPIVVGGFDF